MNNRALTHLYDIKYFSEVATEQIRDKALADYEEDEFFRLAMERCLGRVGVAMIALGELDANLLDSLTGSGSIIEIRNVLASTYNQIDHKQVWNVLVRKLPHLIDETERLMS